MENRTGKKIHKKEIREKETYGRYAHKKGMQDKKLCKTQGKKQAEVIPWVPSEWLYLDTKGVHLRGIYDCLRGEKSWRAEYWEEAGVLEISIPEAGSVDLESMETNPEDEGLCSYMEETKAQAVYAVTIMPEQFERVQVLMRWIVEKLGGIFCGDTADFQPEIK